MNLLYSVTPSWEGCLVSGTLKSNNRRIIVIAAVVSSISALAILLIFVAAILYRTRRYHRYLLLQVRQSECLSHNHIWLLPFFMLGCIPFLDFFDLVLIICAIWNHTEFEEFDVKPTIFAHNELRAATRDFHPEMKLGEGGYGSVYKVLIWHQSKWIGYAMDGLTMLVKQLSD